jgi:hypothetical protein
MSRARDVANLGSDTTNLEDISSAYNAGALSNRNKIINGNFDVWQRGTSFTTMGTFLYSADRWQVYLYSAGEGSSAVQQAFTPGQTDVPNNPKYYMRLTTGGSEYWLAQRIEDVNTAAGQTVTLSWWGRASATTTVTARATQEFGSGGSSAVNVATQNFTFTTSWQKFTWTTDIASIAGKTVGSSSFLQMWWQGNLSSAGTTLDFAQVQLEVGSVATPFEHRSFGQELALCQRYYWKNRPSSIFAYVAIGKSQGTYINLHIEYPQVMRAAPTFNYSNLVAEVGTLTTALATYAGDTSALYQVNTTSGPPAGEVNVIQSASAGVGFLEATAEL